MDKIGREQLEAALAALGELLAARGMRYEVVLVGGGNLILRGLITRPTTKDLDILGERALDVIRPLRPMPQPLRDAVMGIGRAFGLASDWLNVGPDSPLDLGLPDGFTERLERRHFQDLVELRPTRSDQLEAARWTLTHDPSPGFRSLLIETLRALGVEDADGQLG